MKEVLKSSQLIDFYGKLLTEKQYQYLIDYYFNDLTIVEMADKYKISKNAIFDSIKKSIKELEWYESKLNLIASFEKRINLYKNLKIDEKTLNQLLSTEAINYGK